VEWFSALMRCARLGIEQVRDGDQPVAHPVRACTSLMRDEHPPFRLDVRPGETEPMLRESA
jgi:hypothetical protein